MADAWFSCKGCSSSDPTQDTVKVDPNLLNKENVKPLQYAKDNAEEQRRREAEEAAARRRKEEAVAEAARLREGERREAEERTRREAEETARRESEEAARQEAAERTQREAEERRREDEAIALAARAAKEAEAAAKRAADEERKQREAAKAAQEQARISREEAEKKAGVWCKKNGYADMNAQKKTFRGATKFPLHTAVKYNDVEVIHALLLAGAQRDVKDSKSQTPSELAQRMNKDGSHDQIVAMLR